jgi:hypothetical protein
MKLPIAVFTAALAWFACGWLDYHAAPALEHATMQRFDDPERPIRLPFSEDARLPASYHVAGLLTPLPGKTIERVHVVTDDCIRAVSVAGKGVDLTPFSQTQLCDRFHGVDLKIPPARAPVPFEVVFENLGGPYAIDVNGSFTVTQPRMRRLGTQPEPIRLPLVSDQDPLPAMYRVQGDLRFATYSYGRARVTADDCIVSLALDGKPVDLSGFTPPELCNIERGISIDLSRPIGPGTHAFEAVFRNIGGNYAFRLNPEDNPIFRYWRVIQTLIALGIGLLVVPRRLARANAVLLALGSMLRLDFIFTLHPPELHAYSDAGNYLSNAQEIARGVFGVHQLFQGVGYPVLLAWAIKLGHGSYFPLYAIHWAASTATLVLMWRGTARLLGERAATWTLFLAAFHFPFVSLSGFFLAETIYTLVIAALYYCLARWRFPWSTGKGAALGAIFMIGHAIKGLNAFFAPILFVWTLFRERKRGLSPLIRPLGSFVAGVLLVAVIQGAFTRAYWGRVVLSAPTGGLNLVEGKCPAKINKDSTGALWQSPLFYQLGENEQKVWPRPFTDQGFFWKEGLKCIASNPFVLVTSLEYIHYLFADNQLWPPNQSYPRLARRSGMVMTALLWPGILIALLLLLRHPLHRSRLPFLLAAAILFGSWALKAELRYRIPFDVVFLPMAVMGWSWLLARLRLGRASRDSAGPKGP